ncbi:phage tail protein [Xenorhabdus sp. IM139775]|uniref:phage tail protein n=1 Tax=Xenorhabdus sp. IM139775 TaxID=3025876 RepID=UPI0023580F06|nr:phage tail protein [Xenorhabdus sp. IM139775]MDC9593793.1 phage tail protein [Xenorhabdus sp. IM139775]
MSTKFFALLTQLGADKLANAAALGTKIEITHMAVGDGGGSLPTPDTKQTKLINEKRRAAINTLSIDPKNTNQIIAEQVIPENEGGWWIREIGLFDKDGILIAVGNCAETYKPQLQEGSGRTQTIRMILIVSSANAVTLKVDPSVVLATREYVDNSITKHANSRNHPDATLKEKGFVILSSAVDSNSETHAATPKAVKAAYDFANAANNNANGRVPAGRKVNGKALTADISLNAGDVGAYNKGETDARVNEAKNLANARLEKSKNGADIPNRDEFVKNLGLAGTADLARNAYPKTGGTVSGNVNATGYVSGDGVYEAGGIRVYSPLNKPTPDDIGAYPKSGGIVNGNVDATGYVSANGIYESGGKRVYSPNNKPTPDDVGAYPKTGGVLQGNLEATGFVRSGAGQDVTSSRDIWAQRNIWENGQRVYSPNNPPTEVLFGASGWYRDKSNGVIIQWGSGKYRDGQMVKFPRPFTVAACAVTISANPVDTGYLEAALCYPYSLNEFLVGCAVMTGNGFVPEPSLNCTWIAIGY